MATALALEKRLKLGPADHGRPLTWRQFQHAEYQGGYRYELIEGRLYVVTVPKPPHDGSVTWVYDRLLGYASRHPRIVNHVSQRAAVFVPGIALTSAPEPDIAVFKDFPFDHPDLEWWDVSPILVVEVLSEGTLDKDLVRNVRLYRQIPSIREYWIVDNLTEPGKPRMKVHRRRGQKCQVLAVEHGSTYTTKLLPGFELKMQLPSH